MISSESMDTNLSAWFGTDFEGCLELSPLSRGEDGSRPLRTPSPVSWPTVLVQKHIIYTKHLTSLHLYFSLK